MPRPNRLHALFALWALGPVVPFATLATAQGPPHAPPPHAVVLLYHRFGEAAYPTTSVGIDRFEAQIDHLARGGYRIWPLARVVEALAAGEAVPDKVVAITVDDAYASVYKEAYPRLKARKWPFTVFVATDPVDAGSAALMTWAQMREMAAHGAAFANHSASHGHLVRRPDEDRVAWEARVRGELTRADKRLKEENLAGAGPRLFAYPYGEYDADLAALVRSLGYVPFGQQSGAVGPLADPAALPRFPISQKFGGPNDFGLKVASLPLPVRSATPMSPLVTAPNPPRLVLEVVPGDPSLDRLACFAGGQGSIPVTWLDRDTARLAVSAPRPLPPGRGRYNCTAPSRALTGRFYWYSHAWLVRNGGK
jgi:biofilm PGA synthesis lipoprotein PgaB